MLKINYYRSVSDLCIKGHFFILKFDHLTQARDWRQIVARFLRDFIHNIFQVLLVAHDALDHGRLLLVVVDELMSLDLRSIRSIKAVRARIFGGSVIVVDVPRKLRVGFSFEDAVRTAHEGSFLASGFEQKMQPQVLLKDANVVCVKTAPDGHALEESA